MVLLVGALGMSTERLRLIQAVCICMLIAFVFGRIHWWMMRNDLCSNDSVIESNILLSYHKIVDYKLKFRNDL